MTTILAIDPGPTQSAWVELHPDGRVMDHGIHPNNDLLAHCGVTLVSDIVLEQIAAMGMSVGEEVFETVYWSGRFCQVVEDRRPRPQFHRLKRHVVKMHLCQSMRANDSNIRQAIIDRYGGTGGKAVAIGTKKNQGPLYGIKADEWQALALGLTWLDQNTPPAPVAGGKEQL